jgi:hypothetical protein
MKLSNNISPKIKTELFDNLKYSLVTKSSLPTHIEYILFRKLNKLLTSKIAINICSKIEYTLNPHFNKNINGL